MIQTHRIPESVSGMRDRTPAQTAAMTSDQEVARIEAAYSRREGRFCYTLLEPAALLACQERERKLLSILVAEGLLSLQHLRILEVGCGTGFWLREFVKWGARPENMHGIDLLPERIAEAKKLSPSGINLECGSATRLNFADAEFDLVLQSTMFTSILDAAMKVQIAREMLRVLRPTGLIVWYDFRVNNPRNPDVRGIKPAEVRSLFPSSRVEFHSLTLAPPIARPVARMSLLLHRILSSIGPLRTHYLALIRRT
jgi:SAM-dependent methyltransferase